MDCISSTSIYLIYIHDINVFLFFNDYQVILFLKYTKVTVQRLRLVVDFHNNRILFSTILQNENSSIPDPVILNDQKDTW